MRRFLGIALLLCGAGCASSPALREETISTATFNPDLNIDLGAMMHTASGLYYEDMAIGSGDAARRGSHLMVQYIGWLRDGKEFDRSGPATPLDVRLGTTRIIKGWEEGLTGMRAGGVRQLVIPPNLGYGNQEMDRIPANSILVFVVRVLSVK